MGLIRRSAESPSLVTRVYVLHGAVRGGRWRDTYETFSFPEVIHVDEHYASVKYTISCDPLGPCFHVPQIVHFRVHGRI